MVQDTEGSLLRLADVRENVRQLIDPGGCTLLLALEPVIRESLSAAEAYNGISSQPARIR